MMDQAYRNLLTQLHNASPTLPLTTIQNALAHYLAHLSPPPTPLAASAVSAPLYIAQPFTNDKLQSLLTAFRHATHLKYRKKTEDLKNSSTLKNIFSKSLNAALSQWVDDIVKGIQGGHPVLRLSSLSGLLLGIHDLELEVKKHAAEGHTHTLHLASSKSAAEDELIVAVAEIIGTYSYGLTTASPGRWENEFQPSGRGASYHWVFLITFLANYVLFLYRHSHLGSDHFISVPSLGVSIQVQRPSLVHPGSSTRHNPFLDFS
jgi:hypothetical protein